MSKINDFDKPAKIQKSGLTLRQREMRSGYLFIVIWFIGFLLFFVTNFFQTFEFSMKDITFTVNGLEKTFVGLDNFNHVLTKYMMNGKAFSRHLSEAITNMVIDVPLIIFVALFIAIMLNRDFKGRALVRALFFLPVLLSSPAVKGSIMSAANALGGSVQGASYMESSKSSVDIGFNAEIILATLSEFKIPENMISYIVKAIDRIYTLINRAGVQILIFLAALQSIPTSLYEVAKIEGATAYESFWKITLPMVSPLILTNVVYTIVDSYKTSGLYELVRDTAFKSSQYGWSAAMTLVSTACVCLVLLVLGWIVSRFVFYHV